MEELNGVTIYWLISIGMLVGLIADLVMRDKGIGQIPNILWGAGSSVVIGVSLITISIFAPLIYAALGSLTLLFIVNLFSIRISVNVAARTSRKIVMPKAVSKRARHHLTSMGNRREERLFHSPPVSLG